jgi:hypothetical protein
MSKLKKILSSFIPLPVKNFNKRIDLLEKQLQELREQNKKTWGMLEEVRYASVFDRAVVESDWLKNQTFFLNKTAATFSLFYILYRVLKETKPKRILEIGMGETTKLISQYGAYYDDVQHLCCENDKDWIAFFQKEYTMSKNTNIIQLDVELTTYRNESVRTYKGFEKKFGKEKYDLIIIDGPFGGDMKEYSRIDTISILPDSLSKSFVILIDDYERTPEKRMAEDLMKKLEEAGIKYVKSYFAAKKDALLICSEDNSFLKDL